MIDSMTLYNYGLPGESLVINNDLYPVHSFTTEVDVRHNERTRPNQHGLWIGNTFFGKRVFHIEGQITADDSASYIAARKRLLRMLAPKSHILPLQPMGRMDILFTGMFDTLTTEFTLESYPEIPIEGLSPSRTAFQVNLKSFDPRLYGGFQTATATPNLTIVGRSYNKTYNKTYIATTTGGDAVISNIGDVEAHPIVDFYGPVTSPQIIKIDPDGTLHTFELPNLVLNVSDVVRVDFEKRTAKNTITGQNVYSFAHGEWWTLEPGDNTVRTSAFSQLLGSHATFTWRSAYLI